MRCRSAAQYRILRTLVRYGMHGVLEIDKLAAEVGISRRHVFEHLAHLQYIGLLQRKRGYRFTHYQITCPSKVTPTIIDNAQVKEESTNAMTIANDQSSVPEIRPMHSDPATVNSNSLIDNGHSLSRAGHLTEGPVTAEPWVFNHPSLRDIFNELEIDYTDDYDNLVTRCFMDTTCIPHAKPTLYLRCSDGEYTEPGVWRCFRCGRRGYIDQLVRAWTGWPVFTTGIYLRQRQAYDDPNDVVQRTYVSQEDVDLRKYQFRHEYCYERRLDEETCLRYKLGFDKRDWMITMPVFTADRTLVAIKKRAVSGKVFQYLPTEQHVLTLFGMQFVKPESIIWVCEGEFDAMFLDQTLRRYGFTDQCVLSLMGKELSDRVIPQLEERKPVFFVIALDNDKEGQDAVSTLQAKLTTIAPCMVMRYEDEQTKDPNASSEAHLALQARRVQSLASGKVI